MKIFYVVGFFFLPQNEKFKNLQMSPKQRLGGKKKNQLLDNMDPGL